MSLKQPVKYPVEYYSHLDAGAPQLADADGVIKTILKACLVTGYGTKEGAGWTALFEDDYRIVLRRPLRTGNPPDIKIENGVINGVASHRIVSQDNPTGLSDANELASVNLLARDHTTGLKWYLIVSDFGFLFCYPMGTEGYGSSNNPKHMLYCGSLKKMRDEDPDFFVTSTVDTIERDGRAQGYAHGFISERSSLKDMRTGVSNKKFYYVDMNTTERYFNGDYIMQPLIFDAKAIMPFYCALSKRYEGITTSSIVSDSRLMLRYLNRIYEDATARVFYIPLDYWEL